MRWLRDVESAGGPVDQFNQTVMVQAPAGVTDADVAGACCRPCWIGTPCCGCASTDDGRGGWSLHGARGRVGGRAAVPATVDALSDEAVVAARSRLNPAAGVMLSALWVAATGQLVVIVHHLAVDAVSWRILLEDLNIAWAQHRAGQPVGVAGDRDVVRSGGRRCWTNTPTARTS